MEHSKESDKSSGPRIPIPEKEQISTEGMSEKDAAFVSKLTGAPKLDEQGLPPCARWEIWIGKEVEGEREHGEETLFIRDLGHKTIAELFMLCKQRKIERVWFCEEFGNWEIVREALVYFKKVCVAMRYPNCSPFRNPWPPSDVAARVRLYLKVVIPSQFFLKNEDQICVGRPYNEETFEWGSVKETSPSDYLNDERVL